MGNEEITTIKLERSTHQQLWALKHDDETLNEAVRRLLEDADGHPAP
jgi:hypothetical protein